MVKISIWILGFFIPIICSAQNISGKIIDKETQQPIETVAVYFDNTTIGTTTDKNGIFSLDYTDATQSTLVISYLGYEKVLISDFRSKNNISIALVEAKNTLDEVYIDYDDGLTRKQKLRLFRKEFLGTSKFARSCKILNEEDLILRYDKRNKAMFVSSKIPVLVENKALQYKISFEIVDFEVKYNYANLKTGHFTVHSVIYYGTSFYENLKKKNRKKTIKNRDKAYKGSVQHFIRALFNKNLKEENYWIFYDSFRVNEWNYFEVTEVENSDYKKVRLKDKVTILYDKDFQSEIQLEVPEFYIDVYGNYTPIVGVYFSGALGSQRIGDTLPSDYGLVKN